MRFFVTGATGFVGAHFVDVATKAGHSIVAVRRPGRSPQAAPGVTFIDLELADLPPSSMAGCDALVHFAAAGVSPKQATRREMIRVNVEMTLFLLERARENRISRVVVAGTFAEYGRSAERYDLIPPDATLLPTSGYAASKAACFAACHATAIELGIELFYLRIFSAYGDGQFESNFWPSLKRAALAGEDFPMTAGEQLRDFVPVRDVAETFLRAAVYPPISAKQPFVCNVGSGTPVTIRAFAEHWWAQWRARGRLRIGAIPYRENEVMRFAPLLTAWPQAASVIP